MFLLLFFLVSLILYFSSLDFERGRVLRGSLELPLAGVHFFPHADKHMFDYVLELCKSEAKRADVYMMAARQKRTGYRQMMWCFF
jgi:hypothetical protein